MSKDQTVPERINVTGKKYERVDPEAVAEALGAKRATPEEERRIRTGAVPEEREIIVEYPCRGLQTVLVPNAKSKADAMRRVRDMDQSVTPCEFRVTKVYLGAMKAYEGEKDV